MPTLFRQANVGAKSCDFAWTFSCAKWCKGWVRALDRQRGRVLESRATMLSSRLQDPTSPPVKDVGHRNPRDIHAGNGTCSRVSRGDGQSLR